MKKLFPFLVVIFFLAIYNISFPQTIYLNSPQAVGARTNIGIDISIFPGGQQSKIRSFLFRTVNDGPFWPQGFYPAMNLFADWYYCPTLANDSFSVSGVGDMIYFSDPMQIGTLQFYIGSNANGSLSLADRCSMTDGYKYFDFKPSPVVVMDIPWLAYGDEDNDGARTIKDAGPIWDMIKSGTPVSDTVFVKTNLNGDNIINSADLQEFLLWLNLGNQYTPTIFVGSHGNKGKVLLTWKEYNGGYGLFSDQVLTDGDLTSQSDLSSMKGSGEWFYAGNGRIHFVNLDSSISINDKPIFWSKNIVVFDGGKVNGGWTFEVNYPTGVFIEPANIPSGFLLCQNYPNPFNPSTTIKYQIPKTGIVNLKVYNLLGKEVANLVNENKVAGFYEVNFNASKLASGTYIYQLKVNDFVLNRKMILLK